MWVVRLSDKQLEVLRALLRSEEHLGPALKGAVEALDLARWDELPEAELPWEEVETIARRQGISEADVIWDLAGKSRARRPSRSCRSRRRTCGPSFPSPTISTISPGGLWVGSSESA